MMTFKLENIYEVLTSFSRSEFKWYFTSKMWLIIIWEMVIYISKISKNIQTIEKKVDKIVVWPTFMKLCCTKFNVCM